MQRIDWCPAGASTRQQAVPSKVQRCRRVPGGFRILPLPRRLDGRRLHGTPAAALRKEVAVEPVLHSSSKRWLYYSTA